MTYLDGSFLVKLSQTTEFVVDLGYMDIEIMNLAFFSEIQA